jgi:hypothetical protein
MVGESWQFGRKHLNAVSAAKYFTARVISIRRYVYDIGALVGYHAAFTVSSVPTFRDNLSVPSSRVKKSLWKMTSALLWDITQR